MKNLELIKILKSFTKTELKEFERFICSPYHNKGRNLLPYFRVLRKFYPEFTSSKLTKENLYSKLYSNKKFDCKAEILINKLNSSLTLLAKDFLIEKQLEANKYLSGVLLSEALIKKELYQNAEEALSKTESSLLKKGINSDFFWSIKKIYYLKACTLEGLRKMDEYYKLPRNLSLTNLMDTVICYFQERILVHMLKTETWENPDSLIFIKHIKELNFDGIYESLKLLNPQYAIIFDIYHTLYLSYSNLGNEELFSESMKKVFNNLHIFNRTEKHYLFITLINLCKTTEKFTGQSRITDAYEICVKMIESDAYSFVEEHIDNTTFNHIVDHFLRMGKFSEAEEFINDFSSKLPELNKESFISLAKAAVCYARKDYIGSLEHLAKVKKDDVFDVKVKYQTIICYYELGYFKDLPAVIDSFNKLLKTSSKISHTNRKIYLRFISILNILIEAHAGKSPEKKLFKAKQIMKLHPETLGMEWLVQKVYELETKAN
ncbi:MAG: hypothetical protein N2510_08805 [Ignavibacteria bacterium]|nr:hypothetical protein [Ignavibacteria bacterium]